MLPHPSKTSEPLGMESRHQYFLKFSRWFQGGSVPPQGKQQRQKARGTKARAWAFSIQYHRKVQSSKLKTSYCRLSKKICSINEYVELQGSKDIHQGQLLRASWLSCIDTTSSPQPVCFYLFHFFLSSISLEHRILILF